MVSATDTDKDNFMRYSGPTKQMKRFGAKKPTHGRMCDSEGSGVMRSSHLSER